MSIQYFQGDYHVLFGKYLMKIKPQNVLVLSSNCVYLQHFIKNSTQYSIIHCSIIVILNYTFTLFKKLFTNSKDYLQNIYNDIIFLYLT